MDLFLLASSLHSRSEMICQCITFLPHRYTVCFYCPCLEFEHKELKQQRGLNCGLVQQVVEAAGIGHVCIVFSQKLYLL